MNNRNPYGEPNDNPDRFHDPSSEHAVSVGIVFWRTFSTFWAALALWLILSSYNVLSMWQFDSEAKTTYANRRGSTSVAYARLEFTAAGVLAMLGWLFSTGLRWRRNHPRLIFARMTFAFWVGLLLCYFFMRV